MAAQNGPTCPYTEIWWDAEENTFLLTEQNHDGAFPHAPLKTLGFLGR